MLEKEIIINGIKVNYLLSAKFEPDKAIVFLPGWNSAASLFAKQINLDNLLAIDLPGFFGSERPQDTWGASDYALFLKEMLLKLGITRPVLIGHSFGGAVALCYGANNECRKLILIGAAIVRSKTIKKKLYFLGSKVLKIVCPPLAKNLRKSFYKMIASLDYLESGKMSDIYQKIIKEDLQKYLQDVSDIPTTLIWGEKDLDTPLAQAYLIKKQLGSCKLFILAEAGHYCFLDNREEFAKILKQELL